MARDTREKVCKACKRFVRGPKCPVCVQSTLTTGWKGLVVVNSPADSEIAQVLGITAPGRYCLFMK